MTLKDRTTLKEKLKTRKARILLLSLALLIVFSTVFAIVCFADDYYTIRVEYRFNDESVAHDPYVAVLTSGSDVDITVKNPILPGYKAVVSLAENAAEAPQTVLNYPLLSADHTITVYYIPDLVHYKVRYFMQNIRDDLYTENLSLNSSYYERTGYTDSYPDDLDSMTFPGFTNLFHDPDLIAADGSTVFKLYYDRNYYLVDFHLGEGGYGVEPVYAKYGYTFNIAEPKRLGYDFLGWARSNAAGEYLDSSGNVISEETARSSSAYYTAFTTGIVPLGDTYYRAVWQPQHVKFSVVYWSENAADSGYSVIAAKDITQIVVNNELVDVKADMTITPDTYIRNNADTTNIQLKDFFGLNLNYADPSDSRNFPGDPEYDDDIRYDTADNIIDFNDISKGVTEEYLGNQRFFELNTAANMPEGSIYVTDTSKTVAGDGTTFLNIYFKRLPFTLKFFYARQGLTNGVPNGKISLTNSTKNFSKNNYSDNNYMAAVAAGSWQDDIADTLPALNSEYAAYISTSTEDYGNYRYYYYQVTSKFNAPLKNKWFVDSVKPVHKKDYADVEMCIPGSWAVEYGTNYYHSHTTVNNFTIKGMYEKLGIELMFKTKSTNYTELHYLVSWTNTSRTVNWNYGINRVLKFRYLNYVEISEYEKSLLKSDFGLNEDSPNSAVPSDPILDNGVPIREPTADGVGTPIDIQLVRTSSLTSGGSARYYEIVKFNPSNDPNEQPKFYGLKNTFDEIDTEAAFEVDTIDSGDQYDRSKTEYVRTQNVRSNQTPTDLTGYQIENYALNSKGQIILDPTNTTVDWSEDTDTDRRATIRFFYRRRTYNLSFRNGNTIMDEYSQTVPYGEYLNMHTSPYYIPFPAYYNADLRDYYSFGNWYFDPLYSKEANSFSMPADDTILYVKWNPIQYRVKFYNDFGEYSDPDAAPVNTCLVPYNTKILTEDVPMDNESCAHPLTAKPTGARFAGWYYVDAEGSSVRFDPENLPVTQALTLYAAWESTQPAKYRVRYVEKGTDTEVADTDTGTIFVSKTRTFSAKTGDMFNSDHAWVDGEPNWWPVVSSHSILVEPNEAGEEYAPNEFIFEYIHKSDPVYYTVQYLYADTKKPIKDYARQEKSTYYAAVTETAPYIKGYVADSVTKSRVLSASEKTNSAAAQAEELQNNVIIFFYTASDTSAIYQVKRYVQNVAGDGYELYSTDTIYGSLDDVVTVSSVIASGSVGAGFTCDTTATTVAVGDAAPAAAGESVTLTGEPLTISVYYNRDVFGYIVKYVDYEQEKLYDGDPSLWDGVLCTTSYTSAEQKQPVGKDVPITAPASYTYTYTEDEVAKTKNYSRISRSDLVLTIRNDNPDAPAINIIKVYYRVDEEREISYMVVCDHPETTDRYAILSQSSEIVTSAEDIKGSTVTPLTLEDHVYVFQGWFDTYGGEAVTTEYTITPATLPGADMTYYAVFYQRRVTADIEVRYNETGVYNSDETSTEDTDGSITGYTVNFTSPVGYTTHTETEYDKSQNFTFGIRNTDAGMVKYEFTRWYKVDSNGIVTEHLPSGDGTTTVPMTSSCRYIAMFKKSTPPSSVNYEIRYRFNTRAHGVKDYVKKGTLTGTKEMTAALDNVSEEDSEPYELNSTFILSMAPYESNYGETLSWSDAGITRGYSAETGTLTAVVTAVQNTKAVYANYRLLPSDAYTAIPTTIGANRHTDSRLAVINAAGLTYDGKTFSYWEVRKSADDADDVIAKCYDPWFALCMMDSYWITPVYNGAQAADPAPAVTLKHLDYSRNRWTDSEGEISSSGTTDLLYTDFEIAFSDGTAQIYGEDSDYRAGVVFELCGKLSATATFNPARDYGYYSDPTALMNAIKNSAKTYSTPNKNASDTVKTRSIQCSEIDTANLTNKNRIEFAQYYPNAYTLVAETRNYSYSTYLMKATAYLIKDGEVTLSNSVYICFKAEAAKDLAIPE